MSSLLLGSLVFTQTLFAQTFRDDVSYTALLNQYGTATPNGSGITVGVIEPIRDAHQDNSGAQAWTPLTTFSNVDISGKNIVNQSPTDTPLAGSGHATRVAEFLFSNNTSIAPGITTANFYNLEDFSSAHLSPLATFLAQNNSGYLFGGRVFANRLNNFSAIGDFDRSNPVLLRQLDWATATEDAINVISAGNFSRSPAIFSSSYNGIYAGITDGTSGKVSAHVDHLYNGFRQRPDIVTPAQNTSRGTAMASSITATLLETARNPIYSKRSVTGALTSIQNAEKSEVIKAILMAGADRATNNTRINTYIKDGDSQPILDEDGQRQRYIADITDYRREGLRTDNGLDIRYGAGQANVFNSYQILTAGEQDSQEDGGSETVSLLGFDYDEAFGNGTNSTDPDLNSTASYLLPTLEGDAEFYLTLAWNLDVYGADGLFLNALLYDLDLWLFDVTDGIEQLVNFSASSNANTETISQLLLAGRDYEFRVTSEFNVTALLWDYGIAWRTEYLDENGEPLTAASLASGVDSNSQVFSGTSLGTQSAVPLPGAAWLFISALAGMLGLKKIKRCKQPIKLAYH